MRTFLAFICIFIIIAFPIALFSISPSIQLSVEKNNQEYQLAHLDIRFQGNHETLTTIINDIFANNASYGNYEMEFRATTSYQIFHNDQWYHTNIVAVNDSNLPEINKFQIIAGDSSLNQHQVLILESYASALHVEIGDTLSIYTPTGIHSVEIIGLVESIEYLSYDLSLEGALYMNYGTYREYQGINAIDYNSLVLYFEESVPLSSMITLSDNIRTNVNDYEQPLVQVYYFWYVREFSTSAMFQDVLKLTSQVLSIMASVIIIVSGIVIYIITRRYAVEQQKHMGMLYAYGYSSQQILWVFMLRTLFISVLAIGAGIGISKGILQIISSILAERWGILELSTSLSNIALYTVPFAVIFITQVFTYFASKPIVKVTPYEAIRGKINPSKKKKKKKAQDLSNHKQIQGLSSITKLSHLIPLQLKYSLRNLSRNKKRGIMTTFAFIGAIVISFALIQTETSIDQTFSTYFENQLQWDIRAEFHQFITLDDFENMFSDYSGIETKEPYFTMRVEPKSDPQLSVKIRGILPESKMLLIDLQHGNFFSNETAAEGILSSYIAEPLGLTVGDSFEFWLMGREISIDIVGICRDLDSHISCYMNLPALEKLLHFTPINGALLETSFSNEEDIRNLILFLNEDINIQFAMEKETFEASMSQMVDSQTMIIKVMVFLAFSISFITMFVIAFISILERNREIALQRVFGFGKNHILSQIFVEFALLIGIAISFGFLIGGEGLGRVLIYIISELFFEVKIYRDALNYLLIVAFSIGCIILSSIPGINLLRKQNLATSIQE